MSWICPDWRRARSREDGAAGWYQRFGCILLAAFLATSLRAQGSGESSAAGGVRIPQINEEGVLTSLLTGRQVRINPGRPFDITDLTIYFFEEDGETVRMRITSPVCTYDANRGRAQSENAVRVEGDQFTVDGIGFEYRVAAQRMEIFSDVKVVIRQPPGTRLPLLPEPADAAGDEPELENGTP